MCWKPRCRRTEVPIPFTNQCILSRYISGNFFGSMVRIFVLVPSFVVFPRIDVISVQFPERACEGGTFLQETPFLEVLVECQYLRHDRRIDDPVNANSSR